MKTPELLLLGYSFHLRLFAKLSRLMSYDVSLYFRDEVFPVEQWQQVIAEFEPQQHKIRLANERDKRLAEWTISRNDETSWLTLQDVRLAHFVKPVEANWEVGVYRLGHHRRSVWLQFALCYHALILMKDVTFYDRQFDLAIADEADYLKFAGNVLASEGLSAMFKLELVDGQGVPIF